MNLIDIKSPADLKGLSLAELIDITAQARQALMTKVSEHGGHFGPPMGAAEMIMTANRPMKSRLRLRWFLRNSAVSSGGIVSVSLLI